MERWYMKCPFCANEIKKWAIKCQFCEEFLDGRENAKNLIKSTKKWFWYRFFRKDLNLNKKWWHRFFKVIWFISILLFCIIAVFIIIDKYPDFEPTFEFKWYLRDRFESSKETISGKEFEKYLNDWEYLYTNCDSDKVHSLNRLLSGNDSIKKTHLCCAKEWNTDTVLSCLKRKDDDWSHSWFYWKWSHRWPNWWAWTVWEVLDNIWNVACMVWITMKDNGEKYMSFDDWWKYEDKYSPCIFTYKETSKVLVFILWIVLSILWFVIWTALFCAITLFIYYKFIIYIIYWSYKKDK